jgi:hypothetical protein
MVDMDTLQHSNAREIGAENIAHQSWEKLQLTPLLLSQGFTPDQARLAATQVVSSAVYSASELKTTRWIKENSAVCELTGYDMDKVTKDRLYESALHLYRAKDALEKHLSKRTNELFDLEDKIILYDLTNTYFEGEKRNSQLVKFGRSKEKRSDARLVVLALVVNIEGFIKYSSILEGNIADSATLSAMIDKLASHTCPGGTRCGHSHRRKPPAYRIQRIQISLCKLYPAQRVYLCPRQTNHPIGHKIKADHPVEIGHFRKKHRLLSGGQKPFQGKEGRRHEASV